MTGLAWILYVSICVLWGLFTARMQHKLDYPGKGYNKWYYVAAINAISAPISLIVAIIRCNIEPYSEEEDEEK